MTDYDPYDLRKPKRATTASPEWHLQASCVTYLRKRQRYDHWYRDNVRFIANLPEGARTAKRAAIAKSMGLAPGVADLIVFVKRPPPDRMTMIWCELKRETRRNHADGGLSPEQYAWFQWLRDTPVQAHTLYTLDEFIAMVEAQK